METRVSVPKSRYYGALSAGEMTLHEKQAGWGRSRERVHDELLVKCPTETRRTREKDVDPSTQPTNMQTLIIYIFTLPF